MIYFIKRILAKRKASQPIVEYGYELKKFNIDGVGTIEYAQWQHPSESPKQITQSSINFYKKLAPSGSVIIDIGAHTGDTTVPMGLAVGAEGMVIAFEPNPYVFKILEKNASLNAAMTQIKPFCYAATAEDGDFVFNYSDASFCNGGYLSQLENENHNHFYELKIRGVNLEEFLSKNFSDQLSKITLIKIDAEGYDKEILKTIPNIIRNHHPNLMLECYKKLNKQEREELYDVVEGYGYRLYRLDNFEENGAMHEIKKHQMHDLKHFEILALYGETKLV